MENLNSNNANTPQELLQMQSDFISTVSHELRTPLTSIRGFAQTLIKYDTNLTPEQRLKFLTNIEEQSERLITLVENLLATASSKHEKQIFVCKAVNTKEVIKKTLSVISQKYPRKTIKTDISSDTPEILADSDKLEQILLNLIENACKYSYENTDIKISTKTIENNTAISVTNEGITISDKDKQKVFEKFSRLDNPMTRLTQGSGIGLYIASDLATKMNGKIELESENEHTTFTLILPIATPENITKCKLQEDGNA